MTRRINSTKRRTFHATALLLVVFASTLLSRALPPGTVVDTTNGQDAGARQGNPLPRLDASASEPFLPAATLSGTGAPLAVRDTFNGTISNHSMTLQAGQNASLPVIAPADTSTLPWKPVANISSLEMQLRPTFVPEITIPWSRNVSLANVSMDGQEVAQTFYITNHSVIRNVSLFGRGYDHINDDYDVTITVLQGLPGSGTVVVSERWYLFNLNGYYSFYNSDEPTWYDFNLPDTIVGPGVYSLTVKTTRVAVLTGNFDFCMVNNTADPSQGAFNFTGIAWEAMQGDFSVTIGIESASMEFLDTATIQAKMGTSSWKQIPQSTHRAEFGGADGSPWVPALGIHYITPLLPVPYFGTPLIIASNETFDVVVDVNVTYSKAGGLGLTNYSFTVDMTIIPWDASYDASMPAWNEQAINGTVYTMNVLQDTRAFTMEIPSRWTSINATQPVTVTFGNVDHVTIDNVTSYVQKTWRFEATGPAIPATLVLNATSLSNGDTVDITGTTSVLFSGIYQGNASFWTNATSKHWQAIETFSGSTFDFTQDFVVPDSTTIPHGHYTVLVIVSNGTDVGFDAENVTVANPTMAYLKNAPGQFDIDGPSGSTINATLVFATSDTLLGIQGATASADWGPAGTAWSIQGTANPGEYNLSLDSSSTYCEPGSVKNVSISFSKPGFTTATIVLAVHPWRNAMLVASPVPATLRVNQTATISANYTDDAGIDLSSHGPETLELAYTFGNHDQDALGFPVFFGNGSTFSLGLNTTLVPRLAKAGTYPFTLTVQSRLSNGTWYAPGRISATVTVVPLVLNLVIVNFDMTFNESIDAFSVTEFEGRERPVTIWIDATKELVPVNGTSLHVPATGLKLNVLVETQNVSFMEDTTIKGRYKGVVNASNSSASIAWQAVAIATGRDVQPASITVDVHFIPRYRLDLGTGAMLDGLLENRIITSIDVHVTFVDRFGTVRPYVNKLVQVTVIVDDGSGLKVPWTFTTTTNENGTFPVTDIFLPKARDGAFVAIRVSAVGDESIDPGMTYAITIPVLQDFWARNGLGIAVVIAIIALGAFLLIKEGLPRIKVKKAERKIEIVKAKELQARNAIERISIERTMDSMETYRMRAEPVVNTIHMSPPEFITLDVGPEGKRELDIDGLEPVGGGHGTSIADARDALERDMKATLAMASDLENQGKKAEAAKHYTRASELAERLGYHGQAAAFKKKSSVLESEST